MQVWLLVLYMSVGWGNVSTGGSINVDNITSKEKCEKIAYDLKSRLGSKYDWHFCQEITK